MPLRGQLIRFVRNRLSLRQAKALQRYAYAATAVWGPLNGNAKPVAIVQAEPLHAGDWVRVRSQKEIIATLDSTRKLKGCSFMAANGMDKYCGTIQRVLQPMTRFVNECDMHSIKKCKGLVLLDGVMCKGGTRLGRCDRGCYMFWREEWLEKLKEPLPWSQDQVSGQFTKDESSSLAANSVVDRQGRLGQAEFPQVGDLVRVRTKDEIGATLDSERKLKGCCFMDVMVPYCGTVHRVLQPMTRFIDEEDGCMAKNCNGLVLLEDVRCSGDTSLGHCDRTCLLFWRVEWLEKLAEDGLKSNI